MKFSRALTGVIPIPITATSLRTPTPLGPSHRVPLSHTLHFFSSSTNNDTTILKRLQLKDWLTPKEVTTLFNSLSHPSSALNFYNLYSSRKDFDPTEPFCTSLVTTLAQANHFHAIPSLLQTLKQQKRRRFSDEFFFVLIKTYAHVANRIDEAINTLFDMPQFHCYPTPRTFNFVLNVLVNAKLYDVVLEVYNAAPRLGVEVDACCLNILIKGLCACGRLKAAFQVFEEFPKMGLEPNVRTFATLMKGLCEKGKVDEAFALLERMEASGVCADVILFNVLIGGLRKQGRVEEAKEMLVRMMSKGCYPNGSSYQEVLYALLDAKRFSEAAEFVERMVLERFVPSFVSYKDLIRGLCESGVVGDVDWALRHMVRQGFVPRMGTWRQVVKCVVPEEKSSSSVSLNAILEG